MLVSTPERGEGWGVDRCKILEGLILSVSICDVICVVVIIVIFLT